MKCSLLPSLAAVLLLLLVPAPAAQAQAADTTATPIKVNVPAGMKPVLKQGADGGWIIDVVAVDAAAPEAAAPAAKPADKAKAKADKQAAFDKSLEDQLGKLDWDNPVPSSPAFVALGISPENVATPSTPTDLALSLLNGSDRQGRIQTGFALDFSPYAIANPELSHGEYASNWLKRTLYNTTVSLATTKVSEDSDAQRVALGVSIRFWNQEEEVFNQAIATLRPPPIIIDDPRTTADDAAVEARNQERDKAFKTTVNDLFTRVRAAEDLSWGRGSASIAWAPLWLSESGKWNDLEYDGSLAWLGASIQLGSEKTPEEVEQMIAAGRLPRHWHLLGQAQYRDRETIKGEGDDKATYHQDSLLVAGRLRYGTVDLNGSAEIGYLRIWDGPQGSGDAMRYGLSVEKRVADDTWLVVSAGHDLGLSGTLPDESYAVGGIRFGFGKKPTPEEKAAIRSVGTEVNQ